MGLTSTWSASKTCKANNLEDLLYAVLCPVQVVLGLCWTLSTADARAPHKARHMFKAGQGLVGRGAFPCLQSCSLGANCWPSLFVGCLLATQPDQERGPPWLGLLPV